MIEVVKIMNKALTSKEDAMQEASDCLGMQHGQHRTYPCIAVTVLAKAEDRYHDGSAGQ